MEQNLFEHCAGWRISNSPHHSQDHGLRSTGRVFRGFAVRHAQEQYFLAAVEG
jgi:hypothetical protein